MLETIWEIFQTGQLMEAKQKAIAADGLSKANAVSTGATLTQVETLVLANQAMWELLSEKCGVTDNDLIKKMNEIDLRDGKLDGKLEVTRATATDCHDCGKKISKRRSTCYWCGARLEGGNPFATT